MDQTFKLELNVKDINTVLQSLSQMPYAQVVDVIGTIKTQAESQIQQAAPEQSE